MCRGGFAQSALVFSEQGPWGSVPLGPSGRLEHDSGGESGEDSEEVVCFPQLLPIIS